jgi:hypothetical protein
MHQVFNWALILVSPLFACALLERRRVRQRWAKSSFVIIAVVGPAIGLCQLGLDAGWIAVGENASRGFRSTLSSGRGLMLGVVLALAMSGELRGRRTEKLPNKAPEPPPGSVTPRATAGDSK